MSRVNLLYRGGGHCYLLRPNTAAVRAALTEQAPSRRIMWILRNS
jgi:hypothetical protein